MNLYLFRHMITNKVLVSPKFQLETPLLKQIGGHRSSLTIRRDHFVPFAVVSGIASADNHAQLATQVPHPYTNVLPKSLSKLPLSPLTVEQRAPRKKLPKGVFGLRKPEAADEWVKWQIPADVKERTWALCDALNEIEGENVTVFWERDEYRRVVDEANLVWPEYVTHKALDLFRNRYPIVPGLDRKTWVDVATA
ncbi:hypothetical protein BJ741DRAFT_602362 [Chytriomyces cf. hyalinus JEL632]|nr:hypothetical protein BJ741DRAFT_602362 [Chytriomyces cf. hyalinus JEL632]